MKCVPVLAIVVVATVTALPQAPSGETAIRNIIQGASMCTLFGLRLPAGFLPFFSLLGHCRPSTPGQALRIQMDNKRIHFLGCVCLLVFSLSLAWLRLPAGFLPFFSLLGHCRPSTPGQGISMVAKDLTFGDQFLFHIWPLCNAKAVMPRVSLSRPQQYIERGASSTAGCRCLP